MLQKDEIFKKTIVVFILFLLCILGCAKKEPKVLKIGVIQPLTGDVASWGKHGRNAMEIALKEINEQGGINGKKVELIFEDSKGDPKEGVNALNKLIDADKVPIVIGDAVSTVSFALVRIANDRKVVLLSPGSTAARLTKEGGRFFFWVMPSDALQSKITASWIKEMGYTKVAVLYVNNVWGKGLEEFFVDEFPKVGGEIVLNESVEDGQSDYRTVISKIIESKPDCIYAPLYQRGAGQFLKQLREQGVKTQVFGADVYEAPELLETAGDAANGVLFTTFVQKGNEISRKFKEKYNEAFGMDPINYAYFAYDALKIAAIAIERGGYTGEGIRQALLDMKDYVGATGPNIFDEHGDVTTKTFEKMIIKEKKILPFSK